VALVTTIQYNKVIKVNVSAISGVFVMGFATITVASHADVLRLVTSSSPRFGEHLRSVHKNAPGFPVAEHFNSNGHTAADALVCGIKLCDENKQRKRQEMRLIFRLGTRQPRGLNVDFHFI